MVTAASAGVFFLIENNFIRNLKFTVGVVRAEGTKLTLNASHRPFTLRNVLHNGASRNIFYNQLYCFIDAQHLNRFGTIIVSVVISFNILKSFSNNYNRFQNNFSCLNNLSIHLNLSVIYALYICIILYRPM